MNLNENSGVDSVLLVDECFSKLSQEQMFACYKNLQTYMVI